MDGEQLTWGDLTLPDVLQEKLARSFPSAKPGEFCVAVTFKAKSCIAVSGQVPNSGASSQDWVMGMGCVTKLFTAMLAAKAVAAGSLQFENSISKILGLMPHTAALEGITLKDLLEHTHGLDDSDVFFAPVSSSGRIDIELLLRIFENRAPLAAPGQIYSYSSVGPWIVAAILERMSQRPYGEMLQETIFDPLGIRVRMLDALRPQEGACICPAQGGALGLDIRDMLQLLAGYTAEAGWLFGQGDEAERVRLFPGWSPLERGIRFGWKFYGGGWFGHRSTVKGAAVLVRINEQDETGVVVFSQNKPAAAIAAAVFGTLLPDLWRPKIPSLLESDSLDVGRYAGRYRNAAMVVDISVGENNVLELRIYQCHAGEVEPEPFSAALLQAAENHVFFTWPPETQYFPFVQFVCPREGRFEFLWNGNGVFAQEHLRLRKA